MRDAHPAVSRRTHEAEADFRDASRRDALRWLALQLKWERTLDALRYQPREQSAQAA
jgi:hypothetical protein